MAGLISTTPKLTVDPLAANTGTTSLQNQIAGVQTSGDQFAATTTPATTGVLSTATPATTPASVADTVAQTPAATVAPRNVTENETIAGQLNTLLNSDSRYIQSARNRGMETANSRGLINSSLAAGTSERAAIDAALPIAQGDANTYAQSGMSAQQAAQDTALTGYKSTLDSAQQNENFQYRTAENAQNIKANTDLQNARIGLDLTKLDAATRDSFTAAIAPIQQQVQSEISLIQRTPDEVLSPADKAAAINYQQQLLQAQIKATATLYNYNVSWETPTAGTSGTGNSAVVGAVTPGTNTVTPPVNTASTGDPHDPSKGYWQLNSNLERVWHPY